MTVGAGAVGSYRTALAYARGMDARFDHVATLFDQLVPDADRPEDPAAAGIEMLVAPLTEGDVESGVWTCGVGAWDETDYAVDEVMVIVDGHLRVTDTDGTVHDLRRGAMFSLPKGWSGRWEVVEAMKKIYFIVS